MRIHTQIHTHICTYTHIHSQVQTHIHTHIHTHICTYTHIHSHIHTVFFSDLLSYLIYLPPCLCVSVCVCLRERERKTHKMSVRKNSETYSEGE